MNIQDSFDSGNPEHKSSVEKTDVYEKDNREPNYNSLHSLAEELTSRTLKELEQLTVDSKDDTVKVLVSAAFIEKFLIALVELFSKDSEDWGDYLVNEAEWDNDFIDDAHPAYIIFESMHKLAETIKLDLDDLEVENKTKDEVCPIGIEYEFLVRVGDRVRTYSWAYTSPDNRALGVVTGTVKDFLWGNYPASLIVELDDSKELVEIQPNLLEPLYNE